MKPRVCWQGYHDSIKAERPQNENNPTNEDDPNNENNLTNEDDPNNENNPRTEGEHIRRLPKN